MIYCGFTEASAQRFAAFLHVRPPSYADITEAMETILPVLEDMAHESASEYAENLEPGAVISLDGSWYHRRHGHMCILDVIDIKTRKIVDFEIVTKKSVKRNGDTDSAPEALEGVAFQLMVNRLKENKNITEVVKDGDVAIDSMIHKAEWNVKITKDPNHELKHFEKKFFSIVDSRRKDFYGLGKPILNRLKQILYCNPNQVNRIICISYLFYEVLHHPFIKTPQGHLRPWRYANIAEDQILLNKVKEYCLDISRRFVRGHTTNYNEAFHALKARFVPKNFNLGNTGRARLLACILEYNDKHDWLEILYQRLGIPSEYLDDFYNIRFRNYDPNPPPPHEDQWLEEFELEEQIREQEQRQRKIDRNNNIPLHY